MSAPDEYREILRRHQQHPPVQLGALAHELGVRILVSSLPHKVSGTLTKEANDQWTIRVNRDESKTRQRFTIAHEIAHFILHRDEIGNGISDDVFYRSGLSDRREREANRLAAEILMPWTLINKAVDEGVNTPEDLAKSFQVSEAAMKVRLGMPT